MAVSQVVVAKTVFLGPEEQGHGPRCESFIKQLSAVFEAAQRMVQLTALSGGGADNKRAIGDGFGKRLVFDGLFENRAGVDRRLRLAECDFVGVDQTQVRETEVAHGARGRADVQGIAG